MRIGFACKWIDGPSQINGIKQKDTAKQYNVGTTTVAWLNRQTREVAEQRLWDLMVGNIEAVRRLVEKVGDLDEHLRMVRLGSDILPVYTHGDWSYFWHRPDVIAYCEQHLDKWVMSLVGGWCVSVFILVSLRFWHLIILPLLTVQ